MKTLPSLLLGLLASVQLMPAPALAEIVFNDGDWSLDDSSSGDDQSGACTALSGVRVDSGVYYINVIVDKTGTRPVELKITNSEGSDARGFHYVLGSTNYHFAKISNTTYWNVPVGTNQLIDEMKSSNQLNVTATDTGEELPFSMSGATATINQMLRTCGARSIAVTTDFEKSFLPAAVKRLDGNALSVAQTITLREIVARAGFLSQSSRNSCRTSRLRRSLRCTNSRTWTIAI